MDTHTLPDTISFTELRTKTRKLEALLAAQKRVLLTKGSKIVGTIHPLTVSHKKDTTSVPLYLSGVDMGGDYRKKLVKRKDFYE